MYIIKMSRKTLKFDNIEDNKKEFHASKQAVDLNLVDINKIVISDKLGRWSLDDETEISRWKRIVNRFNVKLVKMIKDVNGRFILFHLKVWNIVLDTNMIRPLCIILPQISGYMKYFDNGGKICLLWLQVIANW